MSPSDSLSSLSLPSCRILTVSASLDQALSFVQHVRGYSEAPKDNSAALSDETREPTILGELVKVPWTIKNKYYSADVHFAAHTVHGLTPNLVRDVPAIVFVWAKGEPYRAHIERLVQDMESCEPEVSLAVRVHTECTEEEEEDGEIDEFLSSHGFEYVYAYVTDESKAQVPDGVPNLPRVIDALSTIMWPSMRAKSTQVGHRSPKGPHESAMFNWAQVSGDGSKEEFELDPWKSGEVCSSPTVTDGEEIAKMGFDDDFTEFMTSEGGGGGGDWEDVVSGRPTPEFERYYKTLGSEFGSDEEEMPSREEVEETAGRIFGGRAEDLSGVVERLEEMKKEIAGIEKEEERRKAAARVALGVVYGI